MLSTGSKSKGFTLLEVMAATALLSFGLVMIYQTFFISLDTFGHSLNHLNAQLWIDEKIWRLQDDFRRYQYFNPLPASGTFNIKDKAFSWNLDYSSVEAEELYKVKLTITWHQGPRNIKLLRTAYVFNYASEE